MVGDSVNVMPHGEGMAGTGSSELVRKKSVTYSVSSSSDEDESE